jgi:hypothetical protein
MVLWPSEEGFWTVTAAKTSEIEKDCSCYNGRNFEQNMSNKIFCRIYGLAMM